MYLSMVLCILQMNGNEEQVAERDERSHGDQGNAREGEGGDANDSETEGSETLEGEEDRLLS